MLDKYLCRIELPLFKSNYSSVPLMGRADESVAALMKQPKIINRFDKYFDNILSSIVKSYGDYRR